MMGGVISTFAWRGCQGSGLEDLGAIVGFEFWGLRLLEVYLTS